MDIRVPPNDLALERALLCCVLLDNSTIARIVGQMTLEDFYADRHRIVFEACLELDAKGLPVDPVTLGTRIRELGKIDRVGGPMVFNELLDSGAFPSNAEEYAKRVHKYAVLRGIIRAAQEIQGKAYGEGLSEYDTFVADARTTLGAALDQALAQDQAATTLDATFREIWGDLEGGTEPAGLVKTGHDTLDRTIGGLWPGLVHILAARPSMGKTAVGLNIATNAALDARKTLVMSMEDTRYFLAIRQLGRFADIDTQLLTMRRVPGNRWHDIAQGMTKASGLPLWVDDSPSMSTAKIRAKALAHRDRHGLDLLVIDHLLEIDEDGDSDTQIVSRAMRGVRDIAKELHVPVLLLHQLNRKVEDRAVKIPTLSDLKQSGKIEEAARIIMFLYRPGYYEWNDERRDVQLHVAKANHGRTGMVKLWVDLSRMYSRGWNTMTDGEFPGIESAPADSTKKKSWTRIDGSSAEVRYKEDY